jgi:uncharacterized protein (TIGR03067 family)
MRTRQAFGWLAALALTAGTAFAGEREEQQRLQGNWLLVQTGRPGSIVAYNVGRPVVIAGDELKLNPKTAYRLRLAPTRQPREIDLTVVGTDKVFKGIYRLDDKVLLIHYTTQGQRPRDFEEQGTGADAVYHLKFLRNPDKTKEAKR